MRRKGRKSMKPWHAWMTALWISGCAMPDSDCAWVRRIQPEGPDIAVISRSLKEQIVAHNEKVAAFCR
jgi:hypothetical protein